jgi:osmotically-inducible protein OsmY
LRTLLGLFVLLLLAGAAYYYWRYRPADVQDARQALGSVGEKLQATKTAATVKAALELDRELKQYPIHVDAGGEDGVVVLRGEVPTPDARAAAERRAAAVPDVRQVVNELRVDPSVPAAVDGGRTLGESFDDRALEAKVRMALSLNRDLKGTHIEVRSYRRQVTLAGQVDSPAQHELAVDIARRTSDVVGVTDQIGLRGQAAPASPTASPTAPASAPPPSAVTPTPRSGARYYAETGREVRTS